MLRLLSTALSCLLLAPISPCQTEPKETQKQSIQGKVIDAKTGQPIRRVNVKVEGAITHSVTTGADGSFTMEDLPPGRYMVTLKHTGYVHSATGRWRAITVLPGQGLAGLLFKLQPAGVISGKIVDKDEDPMASVRVLAELTGNLATGPARNSSGSVTTNDLGEYRISDLEPGKYIVWTQPSQKAPAPPAGENEKSKEQLIYASTYYPGTVDKNRAIAVEVHSGEEASANFAALMSHAYRLKGTVVGAPPGIMSQLILSPKNDGSGMDDSAQLQEGNRFEYQSILPGTYEAMMMVMKGFGNAERPEMQMVRLAPSIEVDTADVEGVQLHVEPGGQIHGKFRLDTGEKFDWSQLNVQLQPIQENASGSISSTFITALLYSPSRGNSKVTVDGTFEMNDVPDGSYQLLLQANSNKLRDYYTKSINLGGRDVADSGFAVNGDLFLDVEVSANGGTIDGNVLDGKGHAVPYAIVAILPNSQHRARPDSYQEFTADVHGHFSVPGLTPGSYLVLGFEEPHSELRQPEFLKSYAAKGEIVELEGGGHKTVTPKIISAETDEP